MKVTYDLIEPNIDDVDVEGSRVEVTWKCPVSGKVLATSQADMVATQDASSQVSTAVKRTLLAQGVAIFYTTIGAMFGNRAGTVARVASTTLRGNLNSQIIKPTFNEASRHTAVLKAFERVKERFKWDEDREQFVAK